MRGSPGCGKSTFIKEHELEQYALSPDNIRLMYQSPVMQPDGSLAISQMNEAEVWGTLFKILEARMLRGEFVVIDATNSKTAEMNRYKELAQTYRYRVYCVDFTGLPIDECKRRNAQRPEYKRVPDSAIDKMYSRFATQSVPSTFKVIKPEELDTIWFRPVDMSSYKKIHHIGDIHGCCTVLKEYLKDGIKDDEMYIFCGDYIDRGIENAEVLNYLYDLSEKHKNILMLEGNHERWVWYWAHGGTTKSKEFEMYTRPELNDKMDPKIARQFYRKLGQCAYYTYGDKVVFVTHAGLSCIPDNLTYVATEQMIRGVGRYSDYQQVAEAFENIMPENYYQIFGHRNTEELPVQMSKRTFDLEGRVEFGGHLRVVTLDSDGFHTIELKNNVFRAQDEVPIAKTYTSAEASVMSVVDTLRKSRFVNEKKLGNNVSSFNYTREAFYDKQWDNQTTKARGLFVDTVNGRVVARSYEKFFAIDERPETKFSMLRNRLAFPVTAYVKENGFLGMISYDRNKDDFFIATKSTTDGNCVEYLKEIFDASAINKMAFLDYLRKNDVTFVFECVDPVNDPHIIEYSEPHLFLLDIVKNDVKFEKLPYKETLALGKSFAMEVKTQAVILNNWDEFRDWYVEIMGEDYMFDGHEIEGFVIEDAKGFMLKVKLAFYCLWKKMRWVAAETLRYGNFRRTGSLTTPIENYFFGFCKDLFSNGLRANKPDEDPTWNIIELRKQFLKIYEQKESE